MFFVGVKMPRYAAVCIWRSRDTTKVLPNTFGRHACMLLIDSEEPLEKLPIQETLYLNVAVTNDNFVNVSFDSSDLSTNFQDITFSIDKQARVDACINIGFETTHSSIEDECVNYGRLPDEYVLIPEGTDGTLGINYQKIYEWWRVYSQRYDAFTCITTDTLEMDDNDVKRALSEKVNYVLIKSIGDVYQIAYVDSQGNMNKYQLNDEEKAQVKALKTNGVISWEGCENKNNDVRNLLEKITKNLPNHRPSERIRYDLINHNCSTVVREALKQGGVDYIHGKDVANVAFSSPNGLIKDCYKIKRDCTTTLKDFVNNCVDELKRNDSKYRKDPKQATAKLEKFINLQERLLKGEDVSIEEVKTAASMHRSRSKLAPLRNSDTYNAFLNFKERMGKVVEHAKEGLSNATPSSVNSKARMERVNDEKENPPDKTLGL